MKERLSQRDIARLAGVSPMTVSLALRGHSSIPAETRDRIVALAREHGYRPDPALAALNAYRVDNAAHRFQGVLAWLSFFSRHQTDPHCDGYFQGAQVRAEELGYHLEDFWINEPGLSPGRASAILKNRGVQGLIVGPLPTAQGEITLEWENFSAVALGYSLVKPRLHVVMNHQYRNMKQTVHHLHALGYRRIGLAMPADNDVRVDHNYLGAFHVAQLELLEEHERCAPLLLRDFNREGFLQWLRQERPEALIVATTCSRTVLEWLEAEGLSVPADIGLAVPNILFNDKGITGIDEDHLRIGRISVETVVGMIHRNETGLPDKPLSILAEGIWYAGPTVREQSPVKDPAFP